MKLHNRKRIVTILLTAIVVVIFFQFRLILSLSDPFLYLELAFEPERFVFPSVEERIAYYMGSHWIKESSTELGKSLPPSIKCSPDPYIFASQAVLPMDYIVNIEGEKKKKLREYVSKIKPVLEELKREDSRFDLFSLLVQLGDHPLHNGTDWLPFVVKSRYARPKSEKGNEPIILPFNFKRHYSEVWQLKKRKESTTSWNDKLNAVAWRGGTTGPSGCFLSGKSKLGDCDRLQLVRKYHNVTRLGRVSVDIGFSELFGVNNPNLAKEVEGYLKGTRDMKSMLRYKYLISVQGNDVASDLKWKLYSNSVVFMKPPSKVTWAMEDKLVPFYHYVPLADDFSDLSEKLDWADKHPKECKKIAYRSTKYIEALVTTPQAQKDQHSILTSIFKSYQSRFGHFLHENCKKKRAQNWYESHKDASFVFPSPDERVSYYMGSHWSNKSIAALGKDVPRSIECSPDTYKPDSQVILRIGDILNQKSGMVRDHFSKLDSLLEVLKKKNSFDNFALLVQLGSSPLHAETDWLPVVMKNRYAQKPNNGNEPILLPLEFEKHYGEVLKLNAETNITTTLTPWNDKLDTVFWRGRTDGPYGCFFLSRKSKRKPRNCDRLRLVRRYHNVSRLGSVSVDVGFSKLTKVSSDLSKEIKFYVKQSDDVRSMLRYKYLISVEGKGVDEDLKWKLYSNSVVFMKPPSQVSWAMEDRLVPFYHYIPLADDFSDLFEKLDWANEHQEACRKIAQQSTKFIEALVTSDQAATDQNLILISMFMSYQNRFGPVLNKNCKKERVQSLNKFYKNASFVLPSVEERISYYMGSYWANESITVSGKKLPPSISCSPNPYKPGSQAVLKIDDILNQPGTVRDYFIGMDPVIEVLEKANNFDHFSLLVQLGSNQLHDGTEWLPVVIKSRYARPNIRKEAIILPFDFERQYGKVFKLKAEMKTISTPWDQKTDKVSWRGTTVGPKGCFRFTKDALGNCDRLQLVRKYHDVTRLGNIFVDIGFSKIVEVSSDLSEEVKGYVKGNRDMKSLLQQKYLISVEGNEADAELKWKLYSNSVVFMKPPSKVSWLMEDKLVPFYHYIPLADDFSDLSEKLDWANEHQEACKKIAHQSTKYIEALVTSAQAVMDQHLILTSIFESYHKRFGRFLYDTCQQQTLSWYNSYKTASFVLPSVEERVSYYMGPYWANKSNAISGNILSSSIECSPTPYKPDSQAVLQMDDLLNQHGMVRSYFEGLHSFLNGLKHDESFDQFALLVQLGNNPLLAGTDLLPVVMDSRHSNSGKEPILLPLDFERHYSKIFELKKETLIPWNDKFNTVSWRGTTIGPHGCFLFGKSKIGNCDRLQLVRKYHNVTRLGSTSIDIGFSSKTEVSSELSEEVERYVKQNHDMNTMLGHKYLISVQGNDVDSDLGWKLYSNSVVFMKPPSITTWAMEDNLVPFYHYVPLADDFSDLSDKLKWANEHQEACKKIALQSTKYIKDVVTSKQAGIARHLILTSILKSYQIRFGRVLHENCKNRRLNSWYNSYKSASFVFPSVEERITYYMGSYWTKESSVVLDKDLPSSIECSPKEYRSASQAVLQIDDILNQPGIVRSYFRKLHPLLEVLKKDDRFDHFALLVQLGDTPLLAETDSFPVVIKSRYALPNGEEEPILLPFDFGRQYGKVFQLKANMNNFTTPWKDKFDTIFWRGGTNGPHGCFLFGKSNLGKCDRLQLVRKYNNVTRLGSISVDIGFSKLIEVTSGLSEEIKGYVKGNRDMRSMLQHKYLISVEGNDVDPELKWKLYSNSVVFMKPPSKVSWAMEDKLVPFYHYIPLADDFSDLSEKLDWANKHQEACKEIVHRSTKFIEDLVTSDQAVIDQEYILMSLFKSYHNRFDHFLHESCKKQHSMSWYKLYENATFRFPSAEERVSYYMGSYWGGKSVTVVGKELPATIKCSPNPYKPATQAVLQIDDILNQTGMVREYFSKFDSLLEKAKNDNGFDHFALLVQLGSNPLHAGTDWLPVVIKSRYAKPNSGKEPIMLPFDFETHYGEVLKLKNEINLTLTPWNDKVDAVYWRGGTTGPHGCFLVGKSKVGNCDRLELVRKYHDITRLGNISVDVGFSKSIEFPSDLSEEVARYVKGSHDTAFVLRHKYLISVEGNDVDSDLAWKLYSNSVVFMKPPSKVSWAMEDKLVPFYHYIPLADDYSDLSEKLDWAGRNEEICKKIAQQSTRFIEDLVTSDQAAIDQNLVLASIFKSYHDRFGHFLHENCKKQELLNLYDSYKNVSFELPSR